MSDSCDPYVLASTVLTSEEHIKIALTAIDGPPQDETTSATSSVPFNQRVFFIVSNVTTSVEQAAIFVIKPRNRDPNAAVLLQVIPILSDLSIQVGQQTIPSKPVSPSSFPSMQSLIDSLAVPMLNHGIPSTPSSNANALGFTFSCVNQTATGVTSDTEGLADFLAVLRDLIKVAQSHSFSLSTSHQWLEAYIDDVPSLSNEARRQKRRQSTSSDAPIFSRFTSSSFIPRVPYSPQATRPASPGLDEIRISIATFNVGGQLPQDDPHTLHGFKKWLRASQDPDLIVIGLQEMDTSSGAYLYYTPAREEAWTNAVVRTLGRKAVHYEKVSSKQLVGLFIMLFSRTSTAKQLSQVATASVGVGVGGFVANKGAVAIRLEIGRRRLCFVNSHLSAMEGLQAMERRCWDWNEIYKRMRFKLSTPPPPTQNGAQVVSMVDDVEKSILEAQTDQHFESSTSPIHPQATDPSDASSCPLSSPSSSSASFTSTTAKDNDDKSDTDPTASSASAPATAAAASAAGTDIDSSSRHIESAITDHDVIIHFGDLNFRLDLPAHQVHGLIQRRQYSLLYRYDQLESLRTSGSLFDDFEEGTITFPPTYKFDKGTDRYDTSEKQRVPSWTDRILWRVTQPWDDVCYDSMSSELDDAASVEDEQAIKLLHRQKSQGVVLQSYDYVGQVKFSDHRPVYASFLVRIR